MKKILVQHNGLTHKDEQVKLPHSDTLKGEAKLEHWRDKFNAGAPSHIHYTIEDR